MFDGICGCNEKIKKLKKELEDFKTYVNIPRLESWIQLLKGYSEMLRGPGAPLVSDIDIEDLAERVKGLELSVRKISKKEKNGTKQSS